MSVCLKVRLQIQNKELHGRVTSFSVKSLNADDHWNLGSSMSTISPSHW